MLGGRWAPGKTLAATAHSSAAQPAWQVMQIGLTGDGRKCRRVCTCKNGVPGGVRTCNLPLRRGMLYPIELLRHTASCQAARRTACMLPSHARFVMQRRRFYPWRMPFKLNATVMHFAMREETQECRMQYQCACVHRYAFEFLENFANQQVGTRPAMSLAEH